MKKIAIIMSVLMLSAAVVSAQEDKSEDKDYTRGWYIGAQAGMPMAEADFSSFGADKFRPGWSAGLHAGYRFTPVWSLELTANWGQQFLAEQDCCFERGYWINPTTWERFRDKDFPKTADGYYYKDLKSRTFVQRYGLQVNMNILGFFNRTKDSRWRLDISPAVYAVGTSSDLMTKADKTPVADNLNDWHLGYGGQAQVSYAVAKNMNIGIYGGFTHLTGNPMDGMPELHSTNFIIDAGVKFSFAFGGKKRSGKSAAVVAPAVIAPVVPTEQESELKTENEKVKTETEVKSENEKGKTEAEVKSESEKVKTENEEEVFTSHLSDFTFPVIYFSFNSVWIEPDEKTKIKEIADVMKAKPEMRVRVTAWGDEVGGEEANKRVSLQRAEAVKRMLGKWLIPAERVETVGGGINRTAQNETEARIATTIEIL